MKKHQSEKSTLRRSLLKLAALTPFAGLIVGAKASNPINRNSDLQIDEMRKMLKLHGQNGNWNYDSYMHGMYNGMEYMLAMAENRSPEFRGPPEQWLSELSDRGGTEAVD